jgi:hypothetical protein
LAPLPPILTALYLTGNPRSSWYTDPHGMDLTPILAPGPVESPSNATSPGQQDADVSTQLTTPAASLELLDIYGLHLLDPGVLCGLTRLTALNAGCVHSRHPLAMLTAIESLPKLRYLDLSVEETRSVPYAYGSSHKAEPNPSSKQLSWRGLRRPALPWSLSTLPST